MVKQETVIAIDIRSVMQVIRKRIWLIAAITSIAVATGYILCFHVLKPVYEAKISVVIIKAQENILNQQYDYNDIVMYQELLKTYAQIAISRTVAEKATHNLMLKSGRTESLAGQLIARPQDGTQIMDLMVKDHEPEMCKQKLDALAYYFIEEAKRIFPNGNIHIIDKAATPLRPVSPNKKRFLAASFFLGLVLSMGLTFFIEMFDNTIKSEADVEKQLETVVLGVVPYKE